MSDETMLPAWSARAKLLVGLLSAALLLSWGGLGLLAQAGYVRFGRSAPPVARAAVVPACPTVAPRIVRLPCATAAAPAPATPVRPGGWLPARPKAEPADRQAWAKMPVRRPLAQAAAPAEPAEKPAATTLVLAGRILDANGEPLVGATASVKGTTQVVSTDAAGHYQLEAAVGSTVVYGYGGYEDAEILVGNTGRLDAMLMPAEGPRRRKL